MPFNRAGWEDAVLMAFIEFGGAVPSQGAGDKISFVVVVVKATEFGGQGSDGLAVLAGLAILAGRRAV